MKIHYCPSYKGTYYLGSGCRVVLGEQVRETQGLLSQLVLHAGIHVEVPAFPARLSAYYQALCKYDKEHPDNLFHKSFEIDGMNVAKTLLWWRDGLSLSGWNAGTTIDDCKRLNALADIEKYFSEKGTGTLLAELMSQLRLMEDGTVSVPATYKALEIVVPCAEDLLPDYIKPLLSALKGLGTTVTEQPSDTTPSAIREIHFTQQWQAEAWLSQQPASDYDVWINTDNKRLDNWLHMSGQPVSGSRMQRSNPQITQMFLLAVQLFQRPLNVNTLLQYLYLPECPLNWQLARRLSRIIVNEGGFCNKAVLECIDNYIKTDFKELCDDTRQDSIPQQREEHYLTYLPFDVRKEKDALALVEESADVAVKPFCKFLNAIKQYADSKAEKLNAVDADDVRIAQLRMVGELAEALLNLTGLDGRDTLPFTWLQQWAQSLYEDNDYCQYNAQVGCRFVVEHPADIVIPARTAIWCDFYGDVAAKLSTDFLSPFEQEKLQEAGVLIWNREHETAYHNLMLRTPLHQTTDKLTLVTCEQQGATKLPKHPLYYQLPDHEVTDGDALYGELQTVEVVPVNNHREEDNKEITFDAKAHPVAWRTTESYSALEKLLQNPIDYFMLYTLGFSELSATDIKLSITYGNVAHETIETLFTANRDRKPLVEYVRENYQRAFMEALGHKGALLLLPAHHLDKDRLMHQLRKCVHRLAEIIEENRLTVIRCEQEEIQDLGFQGGVQIKGYIDMLLKDENGNDVVFDLKWSSKKDKFKKLLENNRAAQLALYAAMLQQHDDHPAAVRTAFFVMPAGKLYSKDEFRGENVEKVGEEGADVVAQIRNGYAERRKEINEGKIETAYNMPLVELAYNSHVPDVFPLEDNDAKTNPRKADNIYSDYKCFTI